MAITWGAPIKNSEGWEVRLGAEAVPGAWNTGSLTPATTYRTWTTNTYIWTKYPVYSNASKIAYAGEVAPPGGPFTVAFNHKSYTAWSTANITKIHSGTDRLYLFYGEPYTDTSSVEWYGHPDFPTARVSYSASMPARPYAAPDAPTGVAVARASDTKHTVSWARVNPGAEAKPYQSVLVQRWDHVSNVYTSIATVGNVSSYVDSSTKPGMRYRYRVRSQNSGGASAWVYGPYFYTTPPAPTQVTATRSGADIAVTWGLPSVPGVAAELAQSTDNGVTWSYPGWTSSGSSYLVKAPDPAVQHRYAVRTTAGSLASAWVWTANVVLITAPAAPTKLAPVVADAAQPVTLSWVHNPLDTTAQQAYEVRWRQGGATEWSGTPKTAATGSKHIVPAGLWPAGKTVEWQVRTWGQHADPSRWSAVCLTAVSERPSATITAPAEAAFVSSRVQVRWAFFDPDGGGQDQYRVSLYAADGSTVLWQVARASAWTIADVDHVLQDGMSYVVGVQVADGVGLWSEEARQQIDVTYAPPPTAQVTTHWDEDSATVQVSIRHEAPSATELAAVSCELWRSTDGGDWLRLEAGLPLDTAVVDPIPATSTPSAYRVVTISEIGSTAQSPVILVAPDPEGWIWLNAGPGWTQAVKMRDNAALDVDWSRGAAYHHLATDSDTDLTLPVSVRNRRESDVLDVSVSLAPNPDGGASLAELKAFLRGAEEPLCYRDAKGHRWFVSIPALGGKATDIRESAQFRVTRIRFDEQEGL